MYEDKPMKKDKGLLKNKLFLACFLFIGWMLFLDSDSWITQIKLYYKYKTLKDKKAFYEKQIDTITKYHKALTNDNLILEKFARERYFMKKPGEEIYYIDESKLKQNFD